MIRGPLGALLATLVVLATLWPAVPVQPLSTFDQPFYLGIAYDLRHAGRFTDGYMFAGPGPDGARPPGLRFAPLYPALLAALSRIDPALRAGMDCQVRTEGHDPACPRAAPSVRWLQFAMLATTFVLIWTIALLATARRRLAWTALLLALLAVSGAVMWWRRRPTGLLGAPLPLTRPRFGAGLVAAIVALALYMPLFGATLVIVLVVEATALRRIPAARRWLSLARATA